MELCGVREWSSHVSLGKRLCLPWGRGFSPCCSQDTFCGFLCAVLVQNWLTAQPASSWWLPCGCGSMRHAGPSPLSLALSAPLCSLMLLHTSCEKGCENMQVLNTKQFKCSTYPGSARVARYVLILVFYEELH